MPPTNIKTTKKIVSHVVFKKVTNDLRYGEKVIWVGKDGRAKVW